jgi:rubrerythrin
MTENNIARLIDTAIQREKEAYVFYMNLRDKVTDPATRETIEWVAGEEKKQQAFLEHYRDGGYDPSALEMRNVVFYKIAEYQQEPEITDGMNSQDAFLVASHRELKSHRFYGELAAVHPDGETREILLKIANEELKHKEKMEYLYANAAFPQTSGG